MSRTRRLPPRSAGRSRVPYPQARTTGGRGGSSVMVYTATEGPDILRNTGEHWDDEDGGVLGSMGREAPVWPSGIPAVERCTALIADTIAGLPWQVMRGRERLPAPGWIADPQLRRADKRTHAGLLPSWRLSAVEFWSQAICSLLWCGEAFVYTPVRDSAGAPLAPVWLLNPADVDTDGMHWTVGGQQLDDQDLIVIRARGTDASSVRGMGVLQRHLPDLRLAARMREFADNTLRRGVPAGWLQSNNPDLSPEAAADMKRSWMAAHGGTRKSIAVLPASTQFHALSLDPQALQLIEMRRFSATDVALMFGVPPYLLGLPADSATYANVESRMIEFGQFCLFPWTRRLESGLDAQLPAGTSLKIGLDALLRADTMTRYKAHQIGLAAGFLEAEEVRELEDLPERPAPKKAPPAVLPQPPGLEDDPGEDDGQDGEDEDQDDEDVKKKRKTAGGREGSKG